MQAVPVTEYTLFYEVVDGNLVRYMQPIEIAVHRLGGDGPPLVLLHSLTGGAATLSALAAALGGRFSVVGIDLRGFGGSHRPTLEYAVATWADDLAAVLTELALGEVVAYGHGIGACVAVEALQRGLVAAAGVSGIAFAAGEPAVLDAVAVAGDAGEPVEAALAAASGCEVVAGDLTSPVVPRTIRAWQAYSGPAAPAALEGKLLVLAGERDAFTPAAAPGGAEALAAATGAPLVFLAAGHDLPRERPDEVAAALSSFLDDRR
jgi:pimeloyl-ACP methyl ester carboxylesterase